MLSQKTLKFPKVVYITAEYNIKPSLATKGTQGKRDKECSLLGGSLFSFSHLFGVPFSKASTDLLIQ